MRESFSLSYAESIASACDLLKKPADEVWGEDYLGALVLLLCDARVPGFEQFFDPQCDEQPTIWQRFEAAKVAVRLQTAFDKSQRAINPLHADASYDLYEA